MKLTLNKKGGNVSLFEIGLISLRGQTRFKNGVPKTCDVVLKNGKWFLSVCFEVDSRDLMIRYKALDAGIEFIEVSTQKHKPSQTCPVCMTEKKKLLSERLHECKACGLLLEQNGVERSIVESRLRLIFSEYFVKSRSLKQETMTITSYSRFENV